MLFEISLKHILNALPYIARNFSCLRFPDTCLNRYLQYFFHIRIYPVSVDRRSVLPVKRMTVSKIIGRSKFITCFLLIIQIRKIPGMIVPV